MPFSFKIFARSCKVNSLTCIHAHRDNARTITSLPVSPSSSPLRYGPAHKSCFLSPPHPAYQFVGQSGYNLGEFSGTASRPNPRYTQDPWLETSQLNLNVQTPGTSPRTRLIWDIVNSDKIKPPSQMPNAKWTQRILPTFGKWMEWLHS